MASLHEFACQRESIYDFLFEKTVFDFPSRKMNLL